MKIRKKMTLPALGRRFCAISLVLLCTVAMGQNDAENVSSGEISASGVPLPLPLPLAEWSKIRQQINSGKLQAVNPLGSGPVFQQQAYIKASNTGDDDRFAYSLSISADTLVVGTYFEDSSATGIDGDQTDNMATSAGAAYVYVRNGSVWTQQAYLKASNAEAFDQFGISVAISGDTIVVGASGEASVATGVNGDQTDNTMDFTGAAYVFVRDGVTWTQQAYLKASNAETFDQFGFSVAISGDTVVVGASVEDSDGIGVDGDGSNNMANGAGAAYIFVRSNTTWTEQAFLKASNTDAFDGFGFSVAVAGDTVVVGANNEGSSATGINGDETDNSIFSAGAAYVFTRSGMAWSQQAYLKASNTEDGDEFGRSVAVFGDTVAVGAPAEDSNATGIDGDGTNNSASLAGAAYVFARSNTTWTQQAYLKASNTNPVDEFGSAVAIFGERVVVAAAGEASNATGIDGDQSNNNADTSGAAYVFTRNGTSWAQETYLKASNTESNDQFGFSITISGNTIVAGARLEDSNATGINGDQNNGLSFFSGAAYVFNAETPSADLAVSKTDGQEAVPIGDPITYTLTISNNGPLGVTGALVQDLLQSPLSQGSWECFADPGAKCTATGSGDISDLVDLPSGTSVIYLLTANVEPGFTGTISNTVTVTSPMGVLDPDQNNNSATDQTVTTNLMVDWFSIDGGGGISDGNDIQIIGVIGQADTARMVGGGISVAGGYLPLPVVPSMLADVIFEDGFE